MMDLVTRSDDHNIDSGGGEVAPLAKVDGNGGARGGKDHDGCCLAFVQGQDCRDGCGGGSIKATLLANSFLE